MPTFEGLDAGGGCVSRISETLLARVRAQVAAREALVPLAEIRDRALARLTPQCGVQALRGERVAVVAELGPAQAGYGGLVEQWEDCGVGAIALAPAAHPASQPWRETAAVCSRTRVPVLSLDLVVSSYQLWEARAHGADLVLLTAAALSREALVSLVERAASLGLTAVVDVRDGTDLVCALRAEARAVLVRAPGQAADAARGAICDLLTMVPDTVLRMAECGPAGRADLIAYAKQGADAVLLGWDVLAGGDPRATVNVLASMGAHPSLARYRPQTV